MLLRPLSLEIREELACGLLKIIAEEDRRAKPS